MLVTEKTFGNTMNRPNIGYVLDLCLFETRLISEFFDPQSNPIAALPFTVSNGGLRLQDGAEIIRLTFPFREAIFEEDFAEGSDGEIYTPTITTKVPQPPKELLNYLYTNQGKRWGAFWRDGNGTGWISANPENGLRLITNRTHAQNNALIIKLSGRCLTPAWSLESTQITTLFSETPFGYAFNSDFSS